MAYLKKMAVKCNHTLDYRQFGSVTWFKSSGSREDAAWYRHEELGFNYRTSNIIAGVVRGQRPGPEQYAYIRETGAVDVGADIFRWGLCLTSDNKMTPDQQDVVIEIIRRRFRKC